MEILTKNLIFSTRSCITARQGAFLGLYSFYLPKCNLQNKPYLNVDNYGLLTNSLIGANAKIVTNNVSYNTSARNEYQLCYRFPYIKLASIVNRLKKIHTYTFVAGTPVLLGLFATNVISSDILSVFCALGKEIPTITCVYK